MQMEQKEQGAHNGRKMLLVFIFLCSAFNKSFAQNEKVDFQRNFLHTVTFPDFLKLSCTPVFTNLLIDISEKGTITDIFISDSAPKLLRDQFEAQKAKLDIKIFDSYIARNRLKNCGILISLFYVFGSDYCTNSFSDFMPKWYLTFNTKSYDKLTRVLEPIEVSFYKPVQ